MPAERKLSPRASTSSPVPWPRASGRHGQTRTRRKVRAVPDANRPREIPGTRVPGKRADPAKPYGRSYAAPPSTEIGGKGSLTGPCRERPRDRLRRSPAGSSA